MVRIKFFNKTPSKDELINSDLKWVREDDDGTVAEVDISGRYRGDDETIVDKLPYFLDSNLPSEYHILWGESDY